MVSVRSDRGVSTVLDITLALLLVSASILVIGFYLNSSEEGLEDSQADRTAETLSATTVSVGYDLEALTESDHYEEPDGVESYERTTYGPAAGTIAEAAVVNATVEDERLVPYADSLVDSVAATVEGQFVGSNHHVYITASWRPYVDSSIRGNATVGRLPPVTEDTNAVTMTASSGMPAVDDSDLAEAYAEDEELDDLAEPIARSIVRGYFPVERSQLALERQRLDRAIKTTHYLKMAELVGQDSELERDEAPLARTDSRADDANDVLVDGLSELISNDLESGRIGDDLDEIGDDEDELEAYFEETVSPDDVDITVYTWNP